LMLQSSTGTSAELLLDALPNPIRACKEKALWHQEARQDASAAAAVVVAAAQILAWGGTLGTGH